MSTKADSLVSVLLTESLPENFSPLVLLVSGFFPAEQVAPASPTAHPLDEAVKSAVRGLLRWGGYKPSGRGRPASESLAKALADGRWPCIHPLVDHCNVLSLRSGLPISVLDAGSLGGACRIRLGRLEEEYVFNPSGQVLSVKGLLVLEDAQGPVGSPVKDAQRTKVSDASRDFMVVVWAPGEHAEVGLDVRERILNWCRTRNAACRDVPTV